MSSRSRRKSRIKSAAIAMSGAVFALFAIAATWAGISIYRIDHAIHHVPVPASLMSRGHNDRLVMVSGPDQSEQVFVLHSFRGHTNVLQIPRTLLLPLAGGQQAPIGTLSIRRPAAIINGLERLGLPISQFVGVDLHMFSSNSIIGRLATGQASASSLISNPLKAGSILEQVASHIYLGPGTPTSAVMSLTAISAAHAVAISTMRDPDGRIALASKSGSAWDGLR